MIEKELTEGDFHKYFENPPLQVSQHPLILRIIVGIVSDIRFLQNF